MSKPDLDLVACRAQFALEAAIVHARCVVAFLGCGEAGFPDAVRSMQIAAQSWRTAATELNLIRETLAAADGMASAAVEYRAARDAKAVRA